MRFFIYIYFILISYSSSSQISLPTFQGALKVSDQNQFQGNSATFTNCGKEGKDGPSQGDCNTAYSGTNLEGFVTVSGGIQSWTVPSNATYTIKVYGASGGDNGKDAGWVSCPHFCRDGGKGAIMQGDFTLSTGTVLKILVGHHPQNVNWLNGGGGGTFVVLSDNTPLIIGGGGGGVIYQVDSHSGIDASITTTGNNGKNGSAGGSNGNGGSSTRGGGGGGLLTDGGEDSRRSGTRGRSFLNGSQGGTATDTNTGDGGFGGGGASIRVNNNIGDQGAGGGGGYSGGGGAGSNNQSHGGGGGSFNSGSNQVNSVANVGHGKIEISW